jgi:hypothetical protein
MSLPTLLVLLVVDIIFSAIIYTILPVVVGQNIMEFWKGIQFTGSAPWIGILFWSTFSTSIIFYLFVIAAFTIQMQKPIGRLAARIGMALQFEEHPMFFISLIITFVISIFFGAAVFIGF